MQGKREGWKGKGGEENERGKEGRETEGVAYGLFCLVLPLSSSPSPSLPSPYPSLTSPSPPPLTPCHSSPHSSLTLIKTLCAGGQRGVEGVDSVLHILPPPSLLPPTNLISPSFLPSDATFLLSSSPLLSPLHPSPLCSFKSLLLFSFVTFCFPFSSFLFTFLPLPLSIIPYPYLLFFLPSFFSSSSSVFHIITFINLPIFSPFLLRSFLLHFSSCTSFPLTLLPCFLLCSLTSSVPLRPLLVPLFSSTSPRLYLVLSFLFKPSPASFLATPYLSHLWKVLLTWSIISNTTLADNNV